MKKQNKTNKKSSEEKSTKIKFEETNEGQMLLNSVSAAFYKVRKENQYIGETRIMQNLTKKNNQSTQVKKVDQELERVVRKNETEKGMSVQENILAQIYRKEGYIRTTPPKN